jgi:hypothetical protein
MMYVKNGEFKNGDKSVVRVIINSQQVATVKAYIKEKEIEDLTLIVSYGKTNNQIICNAATVYAGIDMDMHVNSAELMASTYLIFKELLEIEKDTPELLGAKMEKANYEIVADRYY